MANLPTTKTMSGLIKHNHLNEGLLDKKYTSHMSNTSLSTTKNNCPACSLKQDRESIMSEVSKLKIVISEQDMKL
jgi:hypothetical protein